MGIRFYKNFIRRRYSQVMSDTVAPGVVVAYPDTLKSEEGLVVERALAPVVHTYTELLEQLSHVRNKSLVATSGYFNPLHKNHISSILSSKYLPPELLAAHNLSPDVHLTVVINGDWSTRQKLGGDLFMAAEHRADVVRAITGVDLVFIHDDEADHQGNLISQNAFDVFTKGGDRDFASLPQPEQDALIATGTVVFSNVGFEKFENTNQEISSSKLRAAAKGLAQ